MDRRRNRSSVEHRGPLGHHLRQSRRRPEKEVGTPSARQWARKGPLMFIRYLDISDLNDPCASVAAFDICQDPVAKLGRLRSAEAGRFGALCPRQMAMNYKKCPEERHAGCSPD